MQEFDEGYSDDPDKFGERKSKSAPKLLSVLIFGVIAILGSTFAANINLNSSSSVEFGQGMAHLVSCAEGNSITLVPKAAFVNASDNGSFYFTEALFSNIPINCKNTDFYLNAYGATGSALRLTGESCSNGDGTLAVIRFMGDETTQESPFHPSNENNAYLKISNATSNGFSVSWAEGGCSPSSLAQDVHRITLQTKQEMKETAFYNVGDVSPSGGLIFFKNVNSPTSQTYFEVAPRNWNGTDEDPRTPWCVPYGVAQKTLPSDQEGLVLPNVTTTETILGSGFRNTSLMVSWCKSGAAQLAKSYSGGKFFDWHLPSKIELTQLCKFTHGDFSSNLSTPCASGTSNLTGPHSFTEADLWSSTSECDNGGCFANDSYLGAGSIVQDGGGINTRYAPKYEIGNSDGYQEARVRPIRSWTVNIE